MAVITPNTDVILLKVPLEIDDNNQLTFANATAQYNYFYNLPKKSYDHFTYQRKDNTIRVPDLIDNLYGYNYVMYRNTNHSSKWFYAYIEDIQYVSDQVTALTIKTDVWQTWQFNLTYKPCMIEREHTNTDTVGSNTLPENLELGDMVTNGAITNFGGAGDYCVVVEVSQIENQGENATLSYSWTSGSHSETPELNDVSRGTIPLVLGMISGVGTSPSRIVRVFDKAGLSGSVINIYMLPKNLVGSYNEISITATVQTGGGGTDSLTATGIVVPAYKSGVYDLGNTTFTKPTTLDAYTPKNKKLLTYPFCYFNISNSSGSSLPYRYEDFSTTNVVFKTEGTFGAGGQVKTTPLDYKNISSSENGLDYSITAGKYPICSWNSDSYTNWLTQNAVNMNTQWTTTLIQGGADIISGTIMAGPLGAAGGVAATAINMFNLAKEQMLAKTKANLVPDQVRGNLNAGDFTWAKYKTPFTYIPMCVKPEYARCIDEFFSTYGYQTNRVKTPNVTGRRNWNYVKTIGCYIEADIPQDDLAEIKSLFDKGVTFWHNPSTFADYSQNNDII